MRAHEFITEYLTDQQREEYSKYKMTKTARNATDAFFGENNDVIKEPVFSTASSNIEKSETQLEIEKSIGASMTIEQYRTGLIADKYGRQIKLTKFIKDQDLLNKYASDKSRSGSKTKSNIIMTVHRGTEVAGQTSNIMHSWPSSCKNIETGMHRHFLKNEIL